MADRVIPLTQGKVSIVDAADYDFLVHWKWQAHKRSGKWYACRCTRVGAVKRRMIHMHRVILQAQGDIDVDHIDGDGLNNRRSNLRLATAAQNGRNSKLYKNNTSGYKGVGFHKASGRWQARIVVHRKSLHLGWFDDPQQASVAYEEAARKHGGEFARMR